MELRIPTLRKKTPRSPRPRRKPRSAVGSASLRASSLKNPLPGAAAGEGGVALRLRIQPAAPVSRAALRKKPGGCWGLGGTPQGRGQGRRGGASSALNRSPVPCKAPSAACQNLPVLPTGKPVLAPRQRFEVRGNIPPSKSKRDGGSKTPRRADLGPRREPGWGRLGDTGCPRIPGTGKQLKLGGGRSRRGAVWEIDAIDNGISQRDGEPRYALTTNLSARVGHLNPRWNDPDQDTEAGFKRAMELVGGEFMERLDYYHRAWLPARALVEEAIRRRFEVDASGEVLELPQGGCPWKEHVFSLEKELALPGALQLVLYPDRSGQWRVQSIPVGPHTFESRLPLPEQWRGVRDEALSQLTGIPGCVFVHASGFIGGNRTREGALEMARQTLAQRQGGEAQSS
uniref:Chromosome 12 open reading frame 10 n=1 Tax=Apteryx owenii TaxID=8824 RepID=A0A8B9QMF3_APTOW